ncbi:MAG: tetratricopeptide repeat protein [Methanolinea sp.]|nr:tetratricopeptide repeat protein [Methanolinea sp.]
MTDMERLLILLVAFTLVATGCLTPSEEWNQQGEAYHVMGNYKEAVAAFDKAIAIDPQNHRAWTNRGLSLAAMGNAEESETSFARALAIEPGDIRTYYYQAISRNATGNRTGALESLDHAIAISPRDREQAIDLCHALILRGTLLTIENRTEEANASYRRAHEVMMSLL